MFGAVGGVLLVVGVLAGSSALTLAATASGALSLAAVLVWRSQLIEAWRARGARSTVPPAAHSPASGTTADDESGGAS